VCLVDDDDVQLEVGNKKSHTIWSARMPFNLMPVNLQACPLLRMAISLDVNCLDQGGRII